MSLIANPFTMLADTIPVTVMQIYVLIMAALVIGGTIIDVVHKKSAAYFFDNAEKAKDAATKQLSGGKKVGVTIQAVAEDVLTSAEFCNPKRRIAHLLTMYGFIFFLIGTVAMVFYYPTAGAATPSVWPMLFHVGALMVCIGGFWFWFFIRVDVAAEGNPWYRIVRADLFILSLLATNLFGLLWSFTQSGGSGLSALFLTLFILSSAVLFGGVIWSKFAHMFFKPAAAIQKRLAKADGSMDNLPEEADRTDPATRDRHSMDLLKDAPLEMGLGIKREQPQHY